jgi:hypothetical protein
VFAGLAADPLRAMTRPVRHLVNARWLAAHHPEIDLDRPYHKAVK